MQSVVPLMPFFFFFQNQQPATLGFTAGKNNRFPAINKNPVLYKQIMIIYNVDILPQ